MNKKWMFVLIFTLTALMTFPLLSAGEGQKLEVAITIDDLPFVVAGMPDGDHQALKKEKTEQLIKKLRDFKIPAVGFVVSGRLQKDGKPDTANVELLNMWLEAGLELGNHTYSHPSLHRLPVNQYIENIAKGTEVLQPVLTKKGKELRYFRHPMLQTGRTMEIKKQVYDYLDREGLTVAPVTFDNSDWLFAAAYNKAGAKGDTALQKKIADTFVSYLEKKVAFFEANCRDLLGHQVKHILLLHANVMNAENIHRVLTMLKKRGYTFITLEEALTDKTYELGDQFTGRAGISWIHRWAIAKGKKRPFFENEPRTPDFVKKTAEIYSE